MELSREHSKMLKELKKKYIIYSIISLIILMILRYIILSFFPYQELVDNSKWVWFLLWIIISYYIEKYGAKESEFKFLEELENEKPKESDFRDEYMEYGEEFSYPVDCLDEQWYKIALEKFNQEKQEKIHDFSEKQCLNWLSIILWGYFIFGALWMWVFEICFIPFSKHITEWKELAHICDIKWVSYWWWHYHVYYTPSCPEYDDIEVDREEYWWWFCSEKEAIEQWYTKCPSKVTSSNNISSNKTSSLCIIKWNISLEWERIYHLPWCESYNDTIINTKYGERWFCSEQEAIQAWRRKARNC